MGVSVRVVTIVSNLRPGGTQRVACNFARGYKRWGVESALLAYGGGGSLEDSMRDHAEIIIGGPDDGAQRAALRQALQWKPDVVHIHREGPADPRTGAMLRAARGASRIGTSAPVGVIETNVFGRVDYSADCTNIDVHFLLSKWCLWKWRQWSRSLQTAPLGIVLPNLVMHADFSRVSTAERAEFRRKWDIPQNALLFGRIGSPISSKWSRETLEAFATYARNNPNAWLLLIGTPIDLRSSVAAMQETLRRRVVLIDFLQGDTALREAYGAMDVFLHASRIGESFGMVLAESLCCGTPVITLSTPAKDNSQLEVVGHEHGGLVAASVAGMVESMSRLEDAAVRERYARQGAARTAEQFGPEMLIPQALQVASVCAEGLSRPELQRRVLALPGICTEVSTDEIRTLMRRCAGRYPIGTPALLHLISNPLVYRAYRAMTRS
jgi:glycosyltransferase involved in cell wall biosynthesis